MADFFFFIYPQHPPFAGEDADTDIECDKNPDADVDAPRMRMRISDTSLIYISHLSIYTIYLSTYILY